MATADVQLPVAAATTFSNVTEASNFSTHDVDAILNFFKDNEDGSPPQPSYVDRPETYARPSESHQVKITDVSGRESDFTLDKNGFQIYPHKSIEKDFLDDEQIKAQYYPDTEQLLKDA
jgi:hypothetical protein